MHYRKKTVHLSDINFPTKFRDSQVSRKHPSQPKYSRVRHVVIADCTELKVWQLRCLIWHNIHTDVREHGKS